MSVVAAVAIFYCTNGPGLWNKDSAILVSELTLTAQ